MATGRTIKIDVDTSNFHFYSGRNAGKRRMIREQTFQKIGRLHYGSMELAQFSTETGLILKCQCGALVVFGKTWKFYRGRNIICQVCGTVANFDRCFPLTPDERFDIIKGKENVKD